MCKDMAESQNTSLSTVKRAYGMNKYEVQALLLSFYRIAFSRAPYGGKPISFLGKTRS